MQALPSSQLTLVAGWQPASLQTSPEVQASPSSHALPSFCALAWQVLASVTQTYVAHAVLAGQTSLLLGLSWQALLLPVGEMAQK